MPWVYILECRDGSFYVGSTRDLERRLSEHNEGLGAAYTRHRLPVVLRWSAHFDRVDDAYVAEKRLQGWSRSQAPGTDRRGDGSAGRVVVARVGGTTGAR